MTRIDALGDHIAVRTAPLVCDAHRVVESQHVISTRKLVDSDEEQALLESLIDSAKPPMPPGTEFDSLHYLLSTPFRHPPLAWGSRFGSQTERGIWYGSLELETCFAEVAFYRLLFLMGSAASLTPITVELTAFVAQVSAKRALDLTKGPFAKHAKTLTARASYAATQNLGSRMREAGVQAFVFASARALGGGKNVGLFDPTFAKKTPLRLTTWTCTVDADKAEMRQKGLAVMKPKAFAFPRAQFEVDGTFPQPA